MPEALAVKLCLSPLTRYAPGVFKNEVMSDSRLTSGSLYPHTRSLPPHHHTTYTSFQDESVVPMEIVNNNHGDEGGIPTKRPRLLEQLGGSRSRAVSGPVPLVEPAARRKSSLCMPSSPPQVREREMRERQGEREGERERDGEREREGAGVIVALLLTGLGSECLSGGH